MRGKRHNAFQVMFAMKARMHVPGALKPFCVFSGCVRARVQGAYPAVELGDADGLALAPLPLQKHDAAAEVLHHPRQRARLLALLPCNVQVSVCFSYVWMGEGLALGRHVGVSCCIAAHSYISCSVRTEKRLDDVCGAVLLDDPVREATKGDHRPQLDLRKTRKMGRRTRAREDNREKVEASERAHTRARTHTRACKAQSTS